MSDSQNHNLDWLVIFLVYNNNYYDLKIQDTENYFTMEEQTRYILSQIRHTNFNEKVRTIFVEAEIKNVEDMPIATLSILEKSKGKWLHAFERIWRVADSIEILTNIFSLEAILNKIKNKYTARKHMVITAGHGSIVGINFYIPELKPKVSRKDIPFDDFKEKDRVLPGTPPATLEQPAMVLTIAQLEKILFLSSTEIARAFGSVFMGKKVDVLVMYNCLMQNIFTQYEFRDTVDWLVAPISGITLPGFNYDSVLNELSINPGMDAEMASALLVNSIRAGNKYSLYRNDIEGTWKVTGIKLNSSKFNQIKTSFDQLLAEIITSAKSGRDVINCILTTVRFLFNYAEYCLKPVNISDLGVFLAFFKENIETNFKNLSGLIGPVINLQKALKQIDRMHVMEGATFYNNGTNHKEDEPFFRACISNVAIFLPFRQFNSDLLHSLLLEAPPVQPEAEGPNERESEIPSFITGVNYSMLIKKLIRKG